MGYYEPDCDYFEPSEADIFFDEYKEKLKQNLKQEIKEEMQNLKKENEELQDIKNNWETKCQEVEIAKRTFEQKTRLAEQNAKENAKKMRLSELLGDFKTNFWRADNVGIERPKCNKCDERRYIHFKSPAGKDMTEPCSCSKSKPFYKPEKQDCVEFKIDRDNKAISGFYREHIELDCDYYSSGTFVNKDNTYHGENFEDIEKNVYFPSEEKCQKYCDWLNKNVKK